MTRTKEALLNRLDDALRSMYHNATPHHPRNIPEALYQTYDAVFNTWAECEVEYISDGLSASVGEYTKARKRGWPHKGERYAWLVSCITQYGKLYTWGRGGRTLAPEQLISQGGGSSFYVKSGDEFTKTCNAELTHMIQVIEAFNSYVARWNSRENLRAMWDDYCHNELIELRHSAKDTRATLKTLAREAKALAGVAGDAACNALQREIARQKAHHKELVQQIINFSQAAKEA